jgi:hypothetical protein
MKSEDIKDTLRIQSLRSRIFSKKIEETPEK